MRFLVLVIVLFSMGCTNSHNSKHEHDEHGNHVTDDDRTTQSITQYSDSVELFVEFPQLAENKVSDFTCHFTYVEKHKPVQSGELTVSLIQGKKGIRNSAKFLRTGIFGTALKPTSSGWHKLQFDLKTASKSTSFVIDSVWVGSKDELQSNSAQKEKSGNEITFLKEQAWKIDFQTAQTQEKAVYQTIPTSGIWRVAPSDHLTLVAPINGRVNFELGSIMVGSRVKKGDVLITLQSDGLTGDNHEAEVQKAKAILEQAEANFARKKKLYTSKVVSEADFMKAEQDYEIAKTNHDNLTLNYSLKGKHVTIPFDGYIKEVSAENGSFVTQGRSLFTIAHHTSSLLEVQISPAYTTALAQIHDVWYQPKLVKWSSLNATSGKIVSITDEVDPEHPLLSVFAEIYDDVHFPEGSFTEVQISYGSGHKAIVIPESALLENYGQYHVIVQLDGENYERRPVSIGNRNGNDVEITEGLALNEWVVCTGAYQVKMAAMSGDAPSHGHSH
jgi:RND family efflux transporter MFP subunit